jgi:ubiquinone/menaquinone biosynthesis C-methylase UbiE
MKDFENYQKTSKDYDELRRAYGVDLILAKIAEKGRRGLSLLDVGCGTGNYLKSLQVSCQSNKIYQGLVTDFYGVEPNGGMLQQAHKKFNSNEATFYQGPAQKLPSEIADHSIDVVINTQVLHHLVDETKSKSSSKYSEVKKALREMRRVLAPGGLICIDNVFPNQVKSYWFKHLIPTAMKRVRQKMVPFHVFQSVFLPSTTKKENPEIQRIVSLDELLYDRKKYFDPRGPLSETWRNTDSTWALAPPEELKKAIDFVKTKNKENKMMAWIQKKDRMRQQIGLSTLIFIH